VNVQRKGRHYREYEEYVESVFCKSLSAHHFTQPAAHNESEKAKLTAVRVFVVGVENDETLPRK